MATSDWEEWHSVPDSNGKRNCWIGTRSDWNYYQYHYDNKDGWYNLETIHYKEKEMNDTNTELPPVEVPFEVEAPETPVEAEQPATA